MNAPSNQGFYIIVNELIGSKILNLRIQISTGKKKSTRSNFINDQNVKLMGKEWLKKMQF